VKKTRSILEELNSISVDRNKHHILENRVEHLVSSAANIKKTLYELYDEETALDLERRLINSLKSGDHMKFSRGIKKIVKESTDENQRDK